MHPRPLPSVTVSLCVCCVPRARSFVLYMVCVCVRVPGVCDTSLGFVQAQILYNRLLELADAMPDESPFGDDDDADVAVEMYVDKFGFWGPFLTWYWQCSPYCN